MADILYRRVDLVGHAAGQSPDCLHALGLAQSHLLFLPVGDVPDKADESPTAAVRKDDNSQIDRENIAVLTASRRFAVVLVLIFSGLAVVLEEAGKYLLVGVVVRWRDQFLNRISD